MITDARSQGDLIAALHLESSVNSGDLRSTRDQSSRETHVEPEIHRPNEHDPVLLRHRLALTKRLVVSAQALSIKSEAETGPVETSSTSASRAAANVTAWRTYLPADCVAAMIKDGWHRST